MIHKQPETLTLTVRQLFYILNKCVTVGVEITNQKIDNGDISQPDKITVSIDEKPGIQAIGNKGKELLPLINGKMFVFIEIMNMCDMEL